MKYALYILIIAIFSSCDPCKRLLKRCPSSDSISYIERIDTLIVRVPPNTSDVELPLGSIGLTQEDEKQILRVRVKDSIIYVHATCKEQEREIYALRKELASEKTVIKRVKIPTYVKKIPKYHVIAGIAAPILLILIGLFVYLRIKR